MCYYVSLFLVIFTSSVAAQSLQLFTEEFFPYNYTENQQHLGINTELLQLACQQAKLDCSFTTLPWLRAYDLARQTPNSGVFSTVRTPARESGFLWVGPLASSTTYLYRLKSRPQVAPADLEQAKEFGIAVAHGDFFEEYFVHQGFKLDQNLLRVTRKTDAVPLFLKGKVDLLIGSEQVISGWLAPYGKTRADVEAVLDISFIGQNYLALHPKTDPALVKPLQEALQQLTDEGHIKRLLLKYQNQKMPDPGQSSGD